MRRIDLFDGRVIPAERVAIGRLLGLLSDVVVRVATTPEVLRCLQVEAAEELGVRESIDRRGVNVDACRGEPVIRVAVSAGAVGAEHGLGVRAAAGGGRGVGRERLALERLGGKALLVADAVSRGGGGRLLHRSAPLPHADAALTTGERNGALLLARSEGYGSHSRPQKELSETSVEQVMRVVIRSREAESHRAPMQSRLEAQSFRPSGGASSTPTLESTLRRAGWHGLNEMQFPMLLFKKVLRGKGSRRQDGKSVALAAARGWG
jgi:hypothetical protein